MNAMIKALWRTLPPVIACLALVPLTQAEPRQDIEAKTRVALDYLDEHVEEIDKLIERAAGVLVFPDVVELTFGEGGRYGEGALMIDDQPAAYYATSGLSHGPTHEGVRKAELILFMTRDALIKFRNTINWKVGVSQNVTHVQVDERGHAHMPETAGAVLGFTFSDKGEMQPLDLAGTSISRIGR
ncbi:MAG: hypothetical protein ACK5ME_08680 [Parahaliea sp.]